MAEAKPKLTPMQRYAAGALLAVALNRAQIHQTRPPGWLADNDEDFRSGERTRSDSVSQDPNLWLNENSGLLQPVFRCLEIDSAAWPGLAELAGSSPAKHHVEAFMRLLSEESSDASSKTVDQDAALAKAVDLMAQSIESSVSSESKKEKHCEYENECHKKYSVPEAQSSTAVVEKESVTITETGSHTFGVIKDEAHQPQNLSDEKPIEGITMLSYQRKISVLYELLSACLADQCEENKKYSRHTKGYDARHRVALRLIATWFDIKWIKVEAIETMVACSAMALTKADETKEEEARSPDGKWAKWKRGGIIGAAALTGGTLMAITGGLAAPAISAGFSALAPTLGTLVPVIGASGFAAAASAAGTVAGSVAVAASFGAAGAGLSGSKMARRIGDVDEFEFKAIGENHNQGRLAVEILVAGFVFDEKDFVRPWEGLIDNLERYALLWESKHLIAVSTAIQDWLTSRIAMELMKQGAMHTVLNTLLAAFAWPATILVAADFIDSKWTIALDRSM